MEKLPDKTQRLILYNQYEILKLLDPARILDYEEKQDIIGCGYEMAYDWGLAQVIWDPVPYHVCQEALNALVVCDALEVSQITSGVRSDEFWSRFRGFDGNNETSHMGFARLLIERQGKFSRLENKAVNSHMPGSAEKYNRMHAAWKSMGGRYDLTPEEVNEVAKA